MYKIIVKRKKTIKKVAIVMDEIARFQSMFQSRSRPYITIDEIARFRFKDP